MLYFSQSLLRLPLLSHLCRFPLANFRIRTSTFSPILSFQCFSLYEVCRCFPFSNSSISPPSNDNFDVELDCHLALLLEEMRRRVCKHLELHELVKVVIDLGRQPLARFPSGDFLLSDSPIMLWDLENATSQESESKSKCAEKIVEALQYRDELKLLDVNFFTDEKVLEIAKGVIAFNLPIRRANKRIVASENGGLYNPSWLVFNPEWNPRSVENSSKRFKYPTVSQIHRPKSEEDIAFMSITELGKLIKMKQIKSLELMQIFLKRLKRCRIYAGDS